MYELLLPPRVKGLKDVLGIFKEQSDEIRSVPPVVFFEKAVLKISRKYLEKHSWESSCLAYLLTFKLTNMLNPIFPEISAKPQISASLIDPAPNSFRINKRRGYSLEEIRYELGTDVFLRAFRKFAEQLCQKAIVFSCSRYSGRNWWVTQRLNKECFKSSNT